MNNKEKKLQRANLKQKLIGGGKKKKPKESTRVSEPSRISNRVEVGFDKLMALGLRKVSHL